MVLLSCWILSLLWHPAISIILLCNCCPQSKDVPAEDGSCSAAPRRGRADCWLPCTARGCAPAAQRTPPGPPAGRRGSGHCYNKTITIIHYIPSILESYTFHSWIEVQRIGWACWIELPLFLQFCMVTWQDCQQIRASFEVCYTLSLNSYQ